MCRRGADLNVVIENRVKQQKRENIAKEYGRIINEQ